MLPLLLSLAHAVPDSTGTTHLQSRYLDGMNVFSFQTKHIAGRFCMGEADNHFAAMFFVLANVSATQSVDVHPSDVWLDGIERWAPSAYSEHLTHPRTWTGIANLLLTADDQITAVTSRSRAEYYQAALQSHETTTSSGSIVDRVTSQTLAIVRPSSTSLRHSDVTGGAIPTQSEDMLLRSTTLVPGSAIFGVVPFKTKLTSDERSYDFHMEIDGRRLSTTVSPRE